MRCVTPMPSEDIHIFVSHRIDLDSTLVPNPLYYPIRCGAVFDHIPTKTIPGDNTGDNISEKRMSFCEFTVQYWAWKNVDADYYGLCHYRRYLDFSGGRYRLDEHGLLPWPELTVSSMRRFGLLDESLMRTTIQSHDLIVPIAAPVAKMPLPHGHAHTVQELWDAHDGIFFRKEIIDRMFQLIDTMAPEYSSSARSYFNGAYHRGYNCYVMHKALFDRLCRFQFPILAALEQEGWGQDEFSRAPAYVGEMLFGIFCWHVMYQEDADAWELPLVLFAETEPTNNFAVHLRRYLLFWLDQIGRKAAAPFFPLGSRRRELGKQIYRQITFRAR